MVDLIILLLIGLISGLVFLGKWLIVAIAAPFYYGGEAIWNHSQSGVAYKIKKYVICYSISITSAAISYARENKVNLANEYVIAGSLINAKRQSR